MYEVNNFLFKNFCCVVMSYTSFITNCTFELNLDIKAMSQAKNVGEGGMKGRGIR